MPTALSTEPGKSPIVGVRLPRDLREQVIKRAGKDRGALSEFVRQAVIAALDRAEPEPLSSG